MRSLEWSHTHRVERRMVGPRAGRRREEGAGVEWGPFRLCKMKEVVEMDAVMAARQRTQGH